MIYKGNKPLILSLRNGFDNISRIYKGNDAVYAAPSQPFPIASGGTIFYNGDKVIHVITSTGTFTPAAVGQYEVFLVGQGGDGADENAANKPGSGGAGGQIVTRTYNLNTSTYNVTINSLNTQFDSFISVEKGLDADFNNSNIGDGGDYVAYGGTTTFTGGTGFNVFAEYGGGGGAGASENGANATSNNGGGGGDGFYIDWLVGVDVSGTLGADWDNYVAGGGAGASNSGDNVGGLGGGGDAYPTAPTRDGGDGRAFTGGGGGGAGYGAGTYTGGTGGSGLCLVRYNRYY